MLWHNAGRFRVTGDSSSGDASCSYDTTSSSDDDLQPNVTTESAIDGPSTLTITRRMATFGTIIEHIITDKNCVNVQKKESRDICSMQTLWRDHAVAAGSLFPLATWRILDAVLAQSKVVQTKVLNAVVPMLNTSEKSTWPKSRKQVDDAIRKRVGSFHSRVIRRVTFDLSHTGVSALQKPLIFKFIDPVFAWSLCADKLRRKQHVLYFEYKELRNPNSGELLYGASVQNGQIMKKACDRVPSGWVNITYHDITH